VKVEMNNLSNIIDGRGEEELVEIIEDETDDNEGWELPMHNKLVYALGSVAAKPSNRGVCDWYDDASHFNCEYKRLFGALPMSDVEQLQRRSRESAGLWAEKGR
jgi:hypothetical protein